VNSSEYSNPFSRRIRNLVRLSGSSQARGDQQQGPRDQGVQQAQRATHVDTQDVRGRADGRGQLRGGCRVPAENCCTCARHRLRNAVKRVISYRI
jgi:hypothetical protein